MSNPGANAGLGLGIGASIALLFTPAAPLAPFGVGATIIARLIRKKMDDNNSKKEAEERERRKNKGREVANMPIYSFNSRPSYHDYALSNPALDWKNRYADPSIVATTTPETVFAENKPFLFADLVSRQSLDDAMAQIANSSVATEFARQGMGTHVAARRKKHLFGGETTEVVIAPAR